MIVTIDTDIDKCYYSEFKYRAALLIGVSRNTITRWLNGGNKSKKYKHFKVYLETENY